MNRIIIIGNGFDLAHGLEASYGYFIKWLQQETITTCDKYKLMDDKFVRGCLESIKYNNNNCHPSQQYKPKTFEEIVKRYSITYNEIYKNKFLEHIIDELNKDNLKNWVDIEEEYFKKLYECFEKSSVDHIENNYSEHAHKYVKKNKNNATIANAVKVVEKLNQDFRQIKEALENYLVTQNEKSISIKDNLKASIKNWFTNKDNTYHHPSLENILLLNFNYTSLEKNYEILRESNQNSSYILPNTRTIHIHGELKNNKNPIIFGYGNTKTEKYKEIEDLNQNEFLKNMKSMLYGNKDNYKKLIDFAQLKEYQIYIWGHSCGLSDGTLLKMLFEHKNCLSIKPFYCKFKDDEGNYTGNDNYFDIRANISRHFSDQSVFLDRVVNKEYCEELK